MISTVAHIAIHDPSYFYMKISIVACVFLAQQCPSPGDSGKTKTHKINSNHFEICLIYLPEIFRFI